MIQKNRLQRFTFMVGNALDPIIGVSIIGFGAITAVESATYQSWPHIIVTTIEWSKTYSFPIWTALGSSAMLGALLRWRGDPWVWDKLQTLLDRFQEVAYNRFPHHIKDDHRVTLFRYRKWHWALSSPMTEGILPWNRRRLPWSGWLVPVLRSGKTSQKTRAVFMVPDNGNDAEGVAGRAWASNSVTVAENLPSLTRTSAKKQISRYAARTHCPENVICDYLRRGRSLPRSIAAIPIEVRNVPWGVLVLDSSQGDGVTQELVDNFTLIVHSISQILEKAK